MKKGLKLLTCGVICMSTFAWKVNAEEVKITDSALLESCVTVDANVCKLDDDIELTKGLDIRKNVTIDLNGHSIKPEETLKISGGLITVVHGGSLTVKDSGNDGKISSGDSGNVYAAVQLTKKGETDITKTAKLVVDDGTLEGYWYGIVGSGNDDRINTDITINGGTVKGLHEELGLGIYHPQEGNLTVTGGEIIGRTGIEMRVGNLNVTGGTIVADAEELTVAANGSGSTTNGASIAIAPYNADKAINVAVSGGTVKGKYALYESDPNKVLGETNKNEISITGGTFEGEIQSENETKFITNGTFNTDVSEYFDATNDSNSNALYEVVTPEGETQYIVAADEELVESTYIASQTTDLEEVQTTIASLDEFIDNINEFIAGAAEENSEIDEAQLEEATKIRDAYVELKNTLDGKNGISIYDIVYGDYIGENWLSEQEEKQPGKNVKVTLELPTDLPEVKEGFTRKYSVVRFHIDQVSGEDRPWIYSYEVKEIPATEEDGKITFETEKFSTYILAYEDVENITTPETPEEPETETPEETEPETPEEPELETPEESEPETTEKSEAPETSKKPETSDNPKTLDNALTYIVTAIISVIGLMLTTLRITKKQK